MLPLCGLPGGGLPAVPRMTEMDLPTLQLQSCSHLSLGRRDELSRFYASVTLTLNQ